ncbi:MAG: branched-chain amino acid ABC transporter ATP-binding protein/permease [Acidimicrobiales bacterium]
MNRTALGRLRVLLALLAMGTVPALIGRGLPGILTPLQARILGLGACYAAVAIALNLVMGYAGQISLGHFALLGVGAFTTGVLTSPDRLGLPFVLAVPISALSGAAVAFLVGLPALRLRGVYLAIATIGFSYAMERSVFRARALTGGSSGVATPRPIVGSFTFFRNGDLLGVLLVLLGVVYLVDRNVCRSRVGRAFQAVRASEAVAASFGVDVGATKLLAFVLSGAMAGVAGSMYAPLVGTVNAGSFSYEQSLLLVVLVVIGGLGSRAGVVAVAFFYAELPRLLTGIFGNGLRGWDLVLGAVGLMVAVRNHPGGLGEAWIERRERQLSRTDRSGDSAGAAGGQGGGPDAESPQAAEVVIAGLPHMVADGAGTSGGEVGGRGARPGTEAALEVVGLTVRYGGLVAVDDVSLQVPRGQIVGLIGPNGAGKTTLFDAVSGLVRPDSGRVRLLGRDVTRLPAHARAAAGMGRTFQGIGLAKDLSVIENLLLAQNGAARYSLPEALTLSGRAPATERQLRERAREAVAALGFERYADVAVRRLSHGQQRIVELGCVLVTAPELVMLDEPSAGMAPGVAEQLATRLCDIRDQLGRTVLLVEHNVPLVLDVCDSLVVLSSGSVIASGSVDDVAGQAAVVSAYLGEAVPA